MKKGKRNIRGWIILISSIFIVFVVIPYVCWTNYVHSKNLKTRGKIGTGKVIEVKGFMNDKTKIEYYIGNEKFVVIRDAPSYHKKSAGDSVRILYDSLDFATVKILW